MRQVDTIRPDGLRVVVSTFNTANHNEAAAREAPFLTLAELEKIATSTLGQSWVRSCPADHVLARR